MAVFTGEEFMYNNISSSKFGLTIGYIENTSSSENTLSTKVDFITQKLPRRSKVYHLGSVANEQLSFTLSFFRDSPIFPDEREAIAHWLTSNTEFKKLQIIQDNMNTIYYNCYFDEFKYVVFSAQAYGFTATIICDAPFAWKNPQFVEKTNEMITEGIYPNQTSLKLYNISSDSNMTKPTSIIVELGENSNEFRLTNHSNNNEYFQFNGLVVGEKVSINCDLQIIESLTRPNTIIVDKFSGEFLELINGLNKITVEGQIKYIRIDYQSGRKVG